MPATENKTGSPSPSTYKQVINNMQSIEKLLKSLNEMDEDLDEALVRINKELASLGNKITALDKVVTESPETGDITTTPTGMKVVGVHVNTKNCDVDTVLKDYTHGVTWEFKSASVIGLAGKTGVTDSYISVMTVKRDAPLDDEPATLKTTGFQIGYGSDGLNIYRRAAESDTKWKDWVGLELDVEIHQQIVESASQPTDQNVGDYWAQPIE